MKTSCQWALDMWRLKFQYFGEHVVQTDGRVFFFFSLFLFTLFLSPSLSPFFKIKTIFLQQFDVHGKTEEIVQRTPMYPQTPYIHRLSYDQMPYQISTFITVRKAALTHHNGPMSILYHAVHSCYTFCGFRLTYNDHYTV